MKQKTLWWLLPILAAIAVAEALLIGNCENRRRRKLDPSEGGCTIVEMTGPYQCDVVVK